MDINVDTVVDWTSRLKNVWGEGDLNYFYLGFCHYWEHKWQSKKVPFFFLKQ